MSASIIGRHSNFQLCYSPGWKIDAEADLRMADLRVYGIPYSKRGNIRKTCYA